QPAGDNLDVVESGGTTGGAVGRCGVHHAYAAPSAPDRPRPLRLGSAGHRRVRWPPLDHHDTAVHPFERAGPGAPAGAGHGAGPCVARAVNGGGAAMSDVAPAGMVGGWRWPLPLQAYDRAAQLRPAERSALAEIAGRHLGAWPPTSRAALARLLGP